MHGISGAFLSIPILFLIYEQAKGYSKKKLNTKLFEHAKMQIDRDVLSGINQLMKLINQYDHVLLSPSGVKELLEISVTDIVYSLENNDYLGFQVFKNWVIAKDNISKILENAFILQQLEDDQLIAVVDMLDQIQLFNLIHERVKELYLETGKHKSGYKIQKGEDISKTNSKHPDRYLLLKHINKKEYIVEDFGDFPLYQKNKLLGIYKVNQEYVDNFSKSIFALIGVFKRWVELTEYEFIIDPDMFRGSRKKGV